MSDHGVSPDLITAPVLTVASTASVAENTTAVLTASATDVDANDSLRFSLTGTDAAFFSISSDGGVVTFITAPDFESPADAGADNIYDFNVVVTDVWSLTDTQAVAATVADVSEGASSARNRALPRAPVLPRPARPIPSPAPKASIALNIRSPQAL